MVHSERAHFALHHFEVLWGDLLMLGRAILSDTQLTRTYLSGLLLVIARGQEPPTPQGWAVSSMLGPFQEQDNRTKRQGDTLYV